MTSTPITVTEIARRGNTTRDRVLYVIRSRNIESDARAGTVRLFSESSEQLILSELRRIASNAGREVANA